MLTQVTFGLMPHGRGAHLITEEVVRNLPMLSSVRAGLLHLFLQHTSAALALNENASPDVRADLTTYLDRLVPDSTSLYTHADEGPDDMPAHIKAVLVGPSLLIPVSGGVPALGLWQGIYLLEFRSAEQTRSIVATLLTA